MKRILILLLVMLPLSYATYKNLRVEQDVVLSIEKSDPEAAALFHALQGSGLFQNRIFVKADKNEDDVRAALQTAGYSIQAETQTILESPKKLYALFPYLPREVRDRLLSDGHRAVIKKDLESWLSSPGGLGMVRLLQDDPLLLSRELPKLMQTGQGSRPPIIATREGDIDFPKVRKLYDVLKAGDHSFVGADFFALENYEAVHRDIQVCTVLSVLISLLVFRFFCKQWMPLLFLIGGTLVSTVSGLFLTQRFDAEIYGLVLVFASTFVSFNTESLVHLSGMDLSRGKRRSWVAVFSALGTTVIGFLVLLFSSSHMARQLALLSLGSLFGFLAFLALFGAHLKAIRFRPLHLPQWTWKPWTLGLTFVAVAVAMVLLPKPLYKTNLEEFRFSTPYLQTKADEFSGLYSALPLHALAAVKTGDRDPIQVYGSLAAERAAGTFHPLEWWSNKSDVSGAMRQALATMNALYADIGLRLVLDTDPGHWMPDLSSKDYLGIWNDIGPLAFYRDGHLLLFLKRPLADAIPMHPKMFYERILSDLTRNLGEYFLIGLGIMLLYLLPWQRSWQRIALIFLPLMIAGFGLQILFISTGRTISIVHIMGLSLVIAVALDYASILVSTDHGHEEQGKVLLTGALTLAAFGTLLFARHPVLKELALVVACGTAVALLMALFTRLPPSEEQA